MWETNLSLSLLNWRTPDRVRTIFSKYLPAEDDVVTLPGAIVPHDPTAPAVCHVPHLVPREWDILSLPGWKTNVKVGPQVRSDRLTSLGDHGCSLVGGGDGDRLWGPQNDGNYKARDTQWFQVGLVLLIKGHQCVGSILGRKMEYDLTVWYLHYCLSLTMLILVLRFRSWNSLSCHSLAFPSRVGWSKKDPTREPITVKCDNIYNVDRTGPPLGSGKMLSLEENLSYFFIP